MIEKLVEILGEENVLPLEKLNKHTTFRVGGPSKALLLVNTIEELKTVYGMLKKAGEEFFVIGNGSNLLVSDEGYEGYVIKLSGEFTDICVEGTKLTAGSGAILSKVAVAARENSLTGLEFAHGIPGTVGGAMVMNAGAYDGEMSFVVESVEMLREDGTLKTYSLEEMEFGYRNSVMKKERLIALKTVFSLKTGNAEEIQAKMNDFNERRRSKQPLEFPSAGSTFKRPEGAFAGKLIQDSGLAGARVGGACVSTKHCGFVINDQSATASDIDSLMKLIINKVKEDSGFVLEPEVIRIGRF